MKKHTILIIEDNDINREILGEILEDTYNVLFAENGKVGMDFLTRYTAKISLVLLDLQMPVMDGHEVLKAVKNDPDLSEIPIIVVTSNDTTKDEEYCLELGASDFVSKPYNPVIIRLRIKTILHLQETTRSINEKTTFMKSMSHEIRTPLSALYGYAQLLSMPGDMVSDEERQEMAHHIEVSYKMTEALLQDLFDTSALTTSGQFPILLKDFSINEVCQDAVTISQYRIPEGVDMRFTTTVNDDLIIHSDRRRVQQLITNLLTNACKNTKKGEIHLHLSDTENPGKLTISVTDTGIGIPAGKAEIIFKRFVKLNEFKQGAGLGLYICSIIAEKLNGRIYLDTTYTGGARFVFIF